MEAVAARRAALFHGLPGSSMRATSNARLSMRTASPYFCESFFETILNNPP
jgi:hypothetical protein